MSVMYFPDGDFGRLARFLFLSDKNAGRPFRGRTGFSFFDSVDKYEMEYHRLKHGIEPDHKLRIYLFADRLYIANQLAYWHMYSEFPRGRLQHLRGMDVYTECGNINHREAMDIMTGIEYNIYSNDGHCFLGERDTDKLRNLITRGAKALL